MFITGKLVKSINEVVICLISKGEALEDLTQFRQISLCNVSVKVVSKILANKLKPLMIKLAGPNQSSFIPGRCTVDNILITQEIVHSLRRQKGRNGVLLLK